MNKWVKRKWVKALRSGEYAKGTSCLMAEPRNNEFQYCCLGVLGAEMTPEFVAVQSNVCAEFAIAGETAYLPDDLAILWGLDESTQHELAEINDKAEDFGPVIDWIDANL